MSAYTKHPLPPYKLISIKDVSVKDYPQTL